MTRHSSPAIGLSVAALFLLSACSIGINAPGAGSGPASKSSQPAAGRSRPAAAMLTARRALLAMAAQQRKVTSATERVLIRGTGSENVMTRGTIQIRRRPSLAMREDLTVAAAGKSTHLKAILTGAAFYLSEPLLVRKIGKSWLRLPLAALHKGPFASFDQLARTARNNDFLDLAQLFAAVKNARLVGTREVSGVPATEYAGSFRAAALGRSLAAAARKAMAPELRVLGNAVVTFHIWIDRRHFVRRTIEVETIDGETIHTSVTITDINRPVRILLPPSSQTFTPPVS